MTRPRRYNVERSQRAGLLVMLAGFVLVFVSLGLVYFVATHLQ